MATPKVNPWRTGPTALAIGLLLTWTLLSFAPLLPRLSTHTYHPDADYAMMTWVMLWNCRTLETLRFSDYWASNAMHPSPHAFAFSENLMGWSPIACPIWWSTGNPVLTANIVMIFAVALLAVGMFGALRAMGLDVGAALLGGALVAAYPYLRLHLWAGHFHVAALWLVPLVIYAQWRYGIEGRRRDLVLLAVGWYGTFLMSLYVGIYLTLFLIVWQVAWSLTERPRFSTSKVLRWMTVLGLVWAAMGPVFWVYYQTGRATGVVRTSEVQDYYTGFVWGWLTPPSDVWLWGKALRVLPQSRFLFEEDAIFPGLIPLGLFLASYRLRDVPGWLRSLRWAGLVMMLLAIGPRPQGLPWRLPFPLAWIWPIFPPLWGTRGPHRFALLAAFAWSVLGAYWVHRLRMSRRARTGLLLGLLLGVFGETWMTVRPSPQFQPNEVALYRSIGRIPHASVVLHLPMAQQWTEWVREPRHQLGSTYHWKKIVNGISGVWPALQYQLSRELAEFPSTHTVRLLQALDVDTIVMDRAYDIGRRERLRRRPELDLFHDGLHATLWRLRPGPPRSTLDPATDFRLGGPSQAVEGTLTLDVEIPRACRSVLWNPYGTPLWSFDLARPWTLRVEVDGQPEGPVVRWYAPGLFHPRLCRNPVSVDVRPGRRRIVLRLQLPSREVRLEKVLEVRPARPSPVAQGADLRLPADSDPKPPLDLRVHWEVRFPEKVLPGDVLEGDVRVTNPGPFYWPAHRVRGVQIGAVLVCNGRLQVHVFPLPHDLAPGDTGTRRVFVPLPDRYGRCTLYLNLVGTDRDGRRQWFPPENLIEAWRSECGLQDARYGMDAEFKSRKLSPGCSM
ncbi:hypothetical protein HRbin11_00595 [bacterium HR11]|nr:hypothetical protein HRbin11_00595 [bacterium HR11]